MSTNSTEQTNCSIFGLALVYCNEFKFCLMSKRRKKRKKQQDLIIILSTVYLDEKYLKISYFIYR